MAGMMTGVSNSSTMVEFSVTGVCCQDISKTGNMTVRVPRDRMSQAMQNIHRMGGTISGVSVSAGEAAAPAADEE